MSRLISSTALALCFLAGQSFVYSQQTVDDTQSQQAEQPPTRNSSEPPSLNSVDPPSSPDEPVPGERNLPSEQGSQLTEDASRADNQASGIFPDDNSPWFDNDELRRELDLDEDQIRRLNEAYGAAWKRMRSDNDNAAQRNRLSQEARALRMRELQNRFDETFARDSANIFRDEQQRQRFNQLSLQRQGYSAFDNPRLRRELNLNDTQLRQLRDLNNEWNSELELLRGTYAGDRSRAEREFNQLRQRSQTRFQGILNDQQRTAFDEMTGDRFEFGADTFLGAQRRSGAIINNGTNLGTAQDPNRHGSGLGTPEGGTSTGSGLGTPQGGTSTGSGLGTPQSGTGTGTGAGTGTSTGSGAGSGSGAGGSGTASGSGGGSSS